VKQKAIV